MANPKAYLHEWCAKNNLELQFETKQAGSNCKPRLFICEVTVTGHNYIGVGNSTNKKLAQANASKDYLLYLTKEGLISIDTYFLPSNCISGPASNGLMVNASQQLMNNVPPKSEYEEETSNILGEAYRPNEKTNFQLNDFLNDENNVEEAEGLNLHAAVCGDWTIDNAKSHLNQFIQSNKLKNIDYKYSCNPKTFLHEWCEKNNLEPQFKTKQAGSNRKPRFICEVIITGHDYIGIGNSANIKYAQENASKDFLLYLTRKGLVSTDSLASNCISGPASNDLMVNASQKLMNVPPKSVYQDHETPKMLGESYRPVGKANFQFNDFLNDENNVEEAEHLDVNAAVHGGWTIDNAKSRLNQFIQSNKLKNTDYKYSFIGKSHVAELSIYIAKLGRNVTARESGLNKRSASTSCALSFIRQLYHLGVIEPFSGSLKKSILNTVKPYEVNVDPLILNKVYNILQEFNIEPVIKNDTIIEPETTISLISNQKLAEFKELKPIKLSRAILWSPPQPNWNPWLAINIDEGPLATATLDQLSEELAKDYTKKLNSSKGFKESIEMRSQLPVFNKKNEILDIIRKNSIVIIQGSTGCGKTTQVCQFILDEYLKNDQGAYCNIICTQPRKISAISIADRVAFERKEDIGLSVGYSVRFDSIFPRSTGAILFCTVGVLLRKLENGMRGISHVIVDEIHERGVNSDFLMVVLKDMVYNYPDLRVIFMSATINTAMFSKYFNCCPVIDIKGRCYPVKEYFLEDIVQVLNYQPTPDIKKRMNKDYDDEYVIDAQDHEENCNLLVSDDYPPEVKSKVALISEKYVDFEIIEALLTHIEIKMNIPGAVLIFLPGWTLISALQKYLTEKQFFASSKFCVLPLHSQLPCADQRRVFEPVPSGVRKVILSTNIAETSITIDDVVFVINYGKAKIKFFTSHNNMTHYATVWASKTNMQQRKGRAGRVSDGFCFHLCTKARYDKMDDHVTPEMFRSPLHEIALSIKLLRLGDIGQFLSKAIEPPPIDAVNEALVMLKEMKCLGINEELTPLGRILAKLPVEPQIGRMMVLGNILMLGDAFAIIAAICSNMTDIFVFDHRMTPAQRAFSGNRCSDHLALLNAFQQWQSLDYCNINPTEYCERKMLSEPSLTTTADAMEQLKDLFIKIGFPEICFEKQRFDFGVEMHDDPLLDVVSAILTMGFYPNVCYHKVKRKVYTTEGKFALIHKTSVNCNNTMDGSFQSPFFVFAEKVRTTAVSCKQMTMVTPIHLLLFGARKIEYTKELVQLDNWINLKMDVTAASAIVALRPAIESLIVHASEEPGSIAMLSETDIKLINVLKELCNFNCGRYNLSPITFVQGDRPNYRRPFNQTFNESGDASDNKVQHINHSHSSYNSFQRGGRGRYNEGIGYRGNSSSLCDEYNQRTYHDGGRSVREQGFTGYRSENGFKRCF
ncbi:ATP-dependent RNA helicase A-like [Acyrthosiphon pisum]|uniref:RNA helicase n=1 Tax=Acyrthosiphon pisum TaxID=7029 RepID=A0A8R2F8F6_ACYPI|nr:ATP-dependent RNA helicase A-like [Acyrthosiphon pisum]|eukprot:XP_008183325.1 PREDICTED: ATP-dependent RNA helicase A-like isoform X1 [Acyrthosiphon pisum]